MKLVREAADAIFRNSFGAFTYGAFEAVNPGQKLIPNWHIDCLCYQLERMVTGQSGNRLVLNLPPRSLKSLIVSVCLPAFSPDLVRRDA